MNLTIVDVFKSVESSVLASYISPQVTFPIDCYRLRKLHCGIVI